MRPILDFGFWISDRATIRIPQSVTLPLNRYLSRVYGNLHVCNMLLTDL